MPIQIYLQFDFSKLKLLDINGIEGYLEKQTF